MDVKFDSMAAQQLLMNMDRFCREIQGDTKALLHTVDDAYNWKDPQNMAFQRNIYDVARDLEIALKVESEYMRTYASKVKELRE